MSEFLRILKCGKMFVKCFRDFYFSYDITLSVVLLFFFTRVK